MARRAGRGQTQSRGSRRPFSNREGGVMARRTEPGLERLLTVAQVAELLGTTERFPRRLIAERRIRFVRVGRHVRIPESAVAEYIAAGLVEPVRVRWRGGKVVA
jgi:excisionase family DNA binding protein